MYIYILTQNLLSDPALFLLQSPTPVTTFLTPTSRHHNQIEISLNLSIFTLSLSYS